MNLYLMKKAFNRFFTNRKLSKRKVMAVKRVIDELHVQVVGNGLIDMICPKENIDKFIDEMNRLHIRIYGFTWWCHVTQGHEPCGMGGPADEYGDGWYSEIAMFDVHLFDSNEQIRHYLLEVYPSSKDYRPCYTPAFWLEK